MHLDFKFFDVKLTELINSIVIIVFTLWILVFSLLLTNYRSWSLIGIWVCSVYFLAFLHVIFIALFFFFKQIHWYITKFTVNMEFESFFKNFNLIMIYLEVMLTDWSSISWAERESKRMLILKVSKAFYKVIFINMTKLLQFFRTDFESIQRHYL